MKRSLLSIFSFCIILICRGQDSKEPVKVTDLLKIRSATGIILNKDGSKAVFTVTTIEPDSENKGEYKYVNSVWLVNTDGASAPKQLTTKEGSSQASFSPDGKQLAFVRLADGRPQIFLLPLDGGEAVQLTRYKYGAGTPKWSPDGKRIIFSSNIPFKDMLKDSLLNPDRDIPKWPMEKAGITNTELLKNNSAKPNPDGNMDEIRAYLDNNVNDRKAKVMTKLNFQDETDVNPDMSFNSFFVTELTPDAKPLLLGKPFYRYNFADFTPDGKRFIMAADIDSTEHPDRSLESEILMINKDGSVLKLLGDSGKNYNSPRISPSGKWLAFQYGPTSFVSVPKIAVIPWGGSSKDMIEIPFDRNAGGFAWSKDEKYLYFSAQSNGGQPLFRADLDTKKVEQLTDFNSGILSFDLADNKLVYVKTEVNSPFEVYVADADGKNAKRVSSFNSEWISSRKLSIPSNHLH